MRDKECTVSWVPIKSATSEALLVVIEVAKHKLHNPHKSAPKPK